MLSAAIDALAVDEPVARGGRNRAQVVRVREVKISVVQYFHVANERIVDVNHVDETAAAAEPREERLAKAQRKPAHSKTQSKAPAAAKEAYECRAIDWRAKERPRAPAPRAANE